MCFRFGVLIFDVQSHLRARVFHDAGCHFLLFSLSYDSMVLGATSCYVLCPTIPWCWVPLPVVFSILRFRGAGCHFLLCSLSYDSMVLGPCSCCVVPRLIVAPSTHGVYKRFKLGIDCARLPRAVLGARRTHSFVYALITVFVSSIEARQPRAAVDRRHNNATRLSQLKKHNTLKPLCRATKNRSDLGRRARQCSFCRARQHGIDFARQSCRWDYK
jgi:hypothetical protein